MILPFSLSYESRKSQIGYLFLDVLIQENLSLPSDVTMYPIEDGSEDISDHITQNNEELTIIGSISSATSFGMEFGPLCYSKMIDAVDQLRTMHKERKTVKITTGLGTYEDMAFTNLMVQRQAGDKGGQWLDINCTLRKIKKVSLKETDLPPDRAASTGSTKGKTGQSERKSGKSGESSNTPKRTPFHAAVGGGKDMVGKILGR